MNPVLDLFLCMKKAIKELCYYERMRRNSAGYNIAPTFIAIPNAMVIQQAISGNTAGNLWSYNRQSPIEILYHSSENLMNTTLINEVW